MSAEYSVEEVLESARKAAASNGRAKEASMLFAYAERIKADRGMVPDSMIVLLNHIEGLMDSGILPEDVIPVDMWNAVSMHNITHPPAQAAKVDAWQVMCDSIRTHQFIGPRDRLTIDVERLLNEINERRKAAEPVAQGESLERCDTCDGEGEVYVAGASSREACSDCDGSGITAAPAASPARVPKLDAEDWAVLQRLRNALPDVGLNGWHRGVTVLSKLLAAAPSPGESE